MPRAVGLLTGQASRAFPAGVDVATHADTVADSHRGDVAANLRHDARDLMAGDHREDRGEPLLASLMDVGVADPGVLDIDADIVGPDFATRHRKRFKWRVGGKRSVRTNVHGASLRLEKFHLVEGLLMRRVWLPKSTVTAPASVPTTRPIP